MARVVPVDAVTSRSLLTVQVRHVTGTAGELHALPMPTEGDQVELWVMRPTAPAVAMGSAQTPESFDLARLRRDGVLLAERRSGGGAVFIDPAEIVWIDVLAPRSSPLWSKELGETFLLTGRRWQAALGALGVEVRMVETPPARTAAAAVACWAGLGWGEATLHGAKVVGLSQRRTRWGARVQAMAVTGASSARIADYVDPAQAQMVRDAISVAHRPVVEAAGLTPVALEAAVVAAFAAG